MYSHSCTSANPYGTTLNGLPKSPSRSRTRTFGASAALGSRIWIGKTLSFLGGTAIPPPLLSSADSISNRSTIMAAKTRISLVAK